MPVFIAQLAVQCLCQIQGIEIDLVKASGANASVQIAIFKQLLGITHHLDGRSAQLTRLHRHIGGMELMRGANLFQIQRLSFATFGHDQNSGVAGSP